MHTPEYPTAELLIAHAASLRALARRLLVDPHAAEDAVQDTWAIALERPPKNGARIGAWLRVVLRSVVSNRRRTESRRVARESAVARPEAQEAGDEHARALRTVVDAVLALDEPYRSTVLARFFEDLSPREIARRSGIPVHTVESRLQRALEHLRRKLERSPHGRNEGSRRALLLVAGLGSGAVGEALAAGTGAAIVGAKSKMVMVGIVSIAAVWLAWFVWPHAEPSTATDETVAIAVAPDDPGSSRTPVHVAAVVAPHDTPPTPAPAAASVPPPPSEVLRLDVRVVTAEGAPIQGAAVLIAPSRHTLNDVGTTDRDGRAEVRLRTTSGQVELDVAAWHPRSGLSGPWRIAARSGRKTEIRLALNPTLLPELQEQAAIGQHAGDEYEPSAKAGLQTLTRILQAPAAGFGSDAVQLVRGEFQSLARAQELWIRERNGSYGSSYAGSLVPSRPDSRPGMEIQPPEPTTRSGARVTGRVLGLGGRPVEGALVVAGSAGGGSDRRTRTDPSGYYVLDALPAGEIRLFAGSVEQGEARATIFASLDSTSTWDARLDAERMYAGRITSPIVPAHGPALLEWLSVENGRFDARCAFAEPDGQFGFARLPAAKGDLVGSMSGTPLPSLIAASLEASPGERFDELPTAPFETSIVLRFSDPDAETSSEFLRLHHRFQVRVWTNWSVGVERCTSMDYDDGPGRFRIAGLVPGRYTLEFGSEYCGWSELGPIDVKAGIVTDLGVLALPETGFVKVTRRSGSTGARWLVRRGVVETVLEVLERELLEREFEERASHVTPGEYLYFDPKHRTNGVAFTVRAGDSVVVDDGGARYRAKD